MIGCAWLSIESGMLELGLTNGPDLVDSLRIQVSLIAAGSLCALMLLGSLAPSLLSGIWRTAAMALAACLCGIVLVADPAAVEGVVGKVGRLFATLSFGAWFFYAGPGKDLPGKFMETPDRYVHRVVFNRGARRRRKGGADGVAAYMMLF